MENLWAAHSPDEKEDEIIMGPFKSVILSRTKRDIEDRERWLKSKELDVKTLNKSISKRLQELLGKPKMSSTDFINRHLSKDALKSVHKQNYSYLLSHNRGTSRDKKEPLPAIKKQNKFVTRFNSHR